LHAAIELDLFTRIAHGADTASKLAAEMEVPLNGIRLLCEFLTDAGLLDQADEQLKLTEDAAAFLVRDSPFFLADAGRVLTSVPLLRNFEKLPETVRAGRAVVSGESAIACTPDWFSAARAVTDLEKASQAFADKIEFPGPPALKILDVGVLDGAFGIALGRRYPESVIVALDHPAALERAQQNADAAGLGTRYQNIAGDPLLVPLGLEYDAAVVAGSLHRFDSTQINSLFMRLHFALKKTGQFILLEPLLGEGAAPVDSGFRLNVLAATARGDLYSLADVKKMLEATGFQVAGVEPLPAACATLVKARP